MAKITFLKTLQSIEAPAGTELQDLYRYTADSPLRFGCRQGRCGVCAIAVVEGMSCLSPPTKQEGQTLLRCRLPENTRLACQCALLGPAAIE